MMALITQPLHAWVYYDVSALVCLIPLPLDLSSLRVPMMSTQPANLTPDADIISSLEHPVPYSSAWYNELPPGFVPFSPHRVSVQPVKPSSIPQTPLPILHSGPPQFNPLSSPVQPGTPYIPQTPLPILHGGPPQFNPLSVQPGTPYIPLLQTPTLSPVYPSLSSSGHAYATHPVFFSPQSSTGSTDSAGPYFYIPPLVNPNTSSSPFYRGPWNGWGGDPPPIIPALPSPFSSHIPMPFPPNPKPQMEPFIANNPFMSPPRPSLFSPARPAPDVLRNHIPPPSDPFHNHYLESAGLPAPVSFPTPPGPQPSVLGPLVFRNLLLFLPEFFLETCLRQLYLHCLLKLPEFYFSRVARIFEDADLSMPDIKKMAAATADQWKDGSYPPMSWGAMTPEHFGIVSPALSHFKRSWEGFVDAVIREWKTLNVISVLLLS